ncbi:MAG TPA: hypothetical protein VHJ77_07080 [Vicinamibacterales bacterium]|jgi:hypothetical protein|nr:hypothetical protein [Vicinamibacterales bacterium]
MFRALGFAILLGASPVLVWAQDLPSGPISLGDGRVVLGTDVAVTIGERDEVGWFNYTDYEYNALRMFRMSLSGEWRIASPLALVGELRTENMGHVSPYALYLRVRPWRNREIDIQAGRIPPVFGAFGRRAYSNDNPLIGYPLAYQYLTSLRADALPGTADDLLRMRARGWQTNYPLGSATFAPGVPLVTAFRWDTGVEVRAAGHGFEVAGAITSGTLSNPRVVDDNDGKQLAARVTARPIVGLVLGASVARGEFVDDDAVVAAGGSAEDSYAQRAFGADAEYSRGYGIVRAEFVWTQWRIPSFAAPRIDAPLGAWGGLIEGRYRVLPRLYVAARVDWLDFSLLHGTIFGNEAVPWDAPLTRFETGGGWYFRRNLVGRVTWQKNWRDAGRLREKSFVAGQLLFWL